MLFSVVELFHKRGIRNISKLLTVLLQALMQIMKQIRREIQFSVCTEILKLLIQHETRNTCLLERNDILIQRSSFKVGVFKEYGPIFSSSIIKMGLKRNISIILTKIVL